MLSIETCIRRTPCISGHYSIPRGCPLNTGFTVTVVSLSNWHKRPEALARYYVTSYWQVVCYTAVFRVVTKNVTTLKTAV